MMYGEAIEHVAAGRAVYSETYGATLLKMPRDNVIMEVPRVAKSEPAIWPMIPHGVSGLALESKDWKLSGVVLPLPKAAA